MSLPPAVQMHVAQIVQLLGLQSGVKVSALEINMDSDGLVRDVKPKLIYRSTLDKQGTGA